MNVDIKTINDDTISISWDPSVYASGLSIYYGSNPDKFDRTAPVIFDSTSNAAKISGLNPAMRYYFYISPNNHSDFIIARRRVRLDGSVNFRDLGGYKTRDGKQIKWGKIFRSDHLSRLSNRDQVKLQNMGIKLVCDFRTPKEVEKMPDKFPASHSAKYLHLPVIHGELDNTTLFDRIKNGDIDWISNNFMIKGYIKSLEEFSKTWAEVIKRLANPENIPLVFHCTAGKDRAGTFAALLLLLCNIPEQTVIDDHGLSNIFIKTVLNKIYMQIKLLGIDPELTAPYFTASKECVIALIEHIHNNYGSAYNYFIKKGKLNPKIISSMKKNILE